MKGIANRQNKMFERKPARPQGSGPRGLAEVPLMKEPIPGGVRTGGLVLGLVSNLLLAGRIAQSAKHCHLNVHNCDSPETLLKHARGERPALIIFDWDGCEAPAYKVLAAMRSEEFLSGVPSVGCVSTGKAALREEAQRAGCHRVYLKTEFLRDLDLILSRYAK